MILADTGPLVALIHQDDNEHSICKETFLTFSEPLGTVWPVLTEAMYLLSFSWVAQNALWEMTQAGAVEILSLGTDDVARMRELMRKYRDLPMDLADACVVRMTELYDRCKVWTVDRADYTAYRRYGRQTVPCEFPPLK